MIPPTMSDEIEKYKLGSVPRESLLEVVSEKINDDRCESIEWITPPKASRMKPPSTVVAVIVDVTNKQGAIHITNDDGTYIDMVGTEFAGYFVVVPWRYDWRLRGSGSIEVGYVLRKERT